MTLHDAASNYFNQPNVCANDHIKKKKGKKKKVTLGEGEGGVDFSELNASSCLSSGSVVVVVVALEESLDALPTLSPSPSTLSLLLLLLLLPEEHRKAAKLMRGVCVKKQEEEEEE